MKIEVDLANVVNKIQEFYHYEQHRFCTLYAIDLKDSLEIEWVFDVIGVNEEQIIFSAKAKYEDEIPSINDIVVNAWIFEWELHEMMGVKVKNATLGLLLESDAPVAPLRKSVDGN